MGVALAFPYARGRTILPIAQPAKNVRAPKPIRAAVIVIPLLCLVSEVALANENGLGGALGLGSRFAGALERRQNTQARRARQNKSANPPLLHAIKARYKQAYQLNRLSAKYHDFLLWRSLHLNVIESDCLTLGGS